MSSHYCLKVSCHGKIWGGHGVVMEWLLAVPAPWIPRLVPGFFLMELLNLVEHLNPCKGLWILRISQPLLKKMMAPPGEIEDGREWFGRILCDWQGHLNINAWWKILRRRWTWIVDIDSLGKWANLISQLINL